MGFSGGEVARSIHNRKVLSSNHVVIFAIEDQYDQLYLEDQFKFVVIVMFAVIFPSKRKV